MTHEKLLNCMLTHICIRIRLLDARSNYTLYNELGFFGIQEKYCQQGISVCQYIIAFIFNLWM